MNDSSRVPLVKALISIIGLLQSVTQQILFIDLRRLLGVQRIQIRSLPLLGPHLAEHVVQVVPDLGLIGSLLFFFDGCHFDYFFRISPAVELLDESVD